MKITFEGSYTEIVAEMSAFFGGGEVGVAGDTPKPARQKPGPKPKADKNVEAAHDINAATPVAQQAPAIPQTAPVPSDKEVQDALVAVNDKLGIDKAIECLGKFGVKRGRELTDTQKQPFMDLCKSLVG